MFRLPFGRRGEGGQEDPLDTGDDAWSLPDMEAVEYSEIRQDSRDTPSFRYEEGALQPAGVFTAELVGWEPVDARRTQWKFRIVPDDDVHDWRPGTLPFITGTVCRPDNHLFWMMVALGIPDGARTREDLEDPALRQQLRERSQSLAPGELLGRRCRVEVEHLRDDLGDTEARIKSVAPLGWM